MESSSGPRNTPDEDLALIGRAQQHLEPPRGFAITYDVLFSIACGVFVGAQGLPGTVRTSLTVAVVLTFVALIMWWRRRLGWWLSGYAPRRARWVTFGMLVPLLGLALWAWSRPDPWVALTAGATAAAIAFAASRLWAHVWRRERAVARSAA